MKKVVAIFFVPILILNLYSCQSERTQAGKDRTEDIKEYVIEVITEAMDFQTVDTIPSGWNTFRYMNKSQETHFFILEKYPENKTLKDGKLEVIPIFQTGMDLLNEGKTEAGIAAFDKLPAWFFEVVFSGGSGMISPGRTSETTIKLEPGYYVMECYVKMGNGKFHSAMGMVKDLVVADNTSEIKPLMADAGLTISSERGIEYTDSIRSGNQTFSVYFEDQIVHEHFIGHDINLVQLNEDANLEALEKWMNWTDPKGLITPSPAGVVFLGGVNEMPAGNTGYFTATLEPGNYAFISEVPGSLSKNMLKTFTVN